MRISVRDLCGAGGCGLGGLQCGGFVEELWWDAVGVCGGCSIAVAVEQLQWEVAVWGGCGVRKMQCAGVAVGGNKVWGSFSVEEQCCGGVAVWGVFV